MNTHNIHIGSAEDSFQSKIESTMGTDLPEPRVISKAISLYLLIAYPEGAPKRIINIVDGLMNGTGELYANPAFVRKDDGNQASFSLRLGCAHYPHMKLLMTTWGGGTRYFFRVDAHDKH